ncbi:MULTISPECIES: coniferyl aldehyde dehydrogenase [unclassified Brenneria]|uniref:coniferyl aldehyde dehydrogenase n=1 Tax=unclassified Brenneria TaxID=2634434 RepID=UPI0018F0F13D|nr:coniferyl aldehyde dehydrogenase [Brenneria sp. L3-3C-1]MBJ7221954.1 coniferyl aldehyde dehydrogenase [Brenneria sp. L3-3C-1]MEE3643197.1 coniferyl aldehyde dehydrogenase [Brenneria sp. L3_3C_1]
MNVSDTASTLAATVAAMKQAHVQDGPASAELRRDRLARAAQLLTRHRQELVAAIGADYGHRSPYQSLLADVLSPIGTLQYAAENVEQWMQADEQAAPAPGMQARVQYQPLGVVGIISPWNFPLNLAFSPLAGVLAAGNRALIKPSELTPRTAALLADLIGRYFDPLELTTVLGDADMGAAFSAQPFDHLVFTGSTTVGRHVMRAAAENLVPVTLELGGKSPVVIDTDADVQMAAERVLTIKTFNAGQICISPDYVMLPDSARDAFVEHARSFITRSFPTLQQNPDYTAIINDRHFQRLQSLLDDARAKGATVIGLEPEGETHADAATRKMAPTLVLDATDEMLVMQEEIFGPILPLKTYRRIEDTLDYINAHPRPLAAYYFGQAPERQRQFAERTTSGALVINDVMTHALVESIPFGGVGASGIGAYHGIHGFRRFSHAKAVVVQSPDGEFNLRMRAPYAANQTQIEALFGD